MKNKNNMNMVEELNDNSELRVDAPNFESTLVFQAQDLLRGFFDEQDGTNNLALIKDECETDEELIARLKLYQLGSEMFLKMSTSRRQIFRFWIENKSINEISRLCGCSYQNVQKIVTLIKKDMKNLQKSLKGE